MPNIQQLPPNVVNKIAAGEVIERPASVVKELMENAVDAGAKRIDVVLEKGGSELIRVVDDGCGIPRDQLPLALASHATSKIIDADDLFRVSTLGFRGEALASIAAVSQFVLRSLARTNAGSASDGSGFQLDSHGGRLEEIVPCGCPTGTTVEVRNLFFNTPVRRKFLRTVTTELGHASEAFTRIALAHPDIHFTLTHNTRSIHNLPVDNHWQRRIAALCGDEIGESLIWVESDDDDYRLRGFIAHPDMSRSHNRMQYLFLNGRSIRDRSLQHALGEAYRGLLLHGRYPICFLRVDMPADAIDVNVHPTKLEVRFAESGRLYSQLLGTLRTRFLTSDLTTRLGASETQDTQGETLVDQQSAQSVRDDFVSWAKGEVAEADAATATGNQHQGNQQQQQQFQLPYEPSNAGLQLRHVDRPSTGLASDAASNFRPGLRVDGAESDHITGRPASHSSGHPSDENNPQSAPTAMQIHNRYLVTENDEGVVVIDQHALHERILYEQLREKVLSGQMETQQLLVPEPVHLSASECAAALEHKDLLSQLGITVEEFGGDSVLVSSYPAMLANFRPAEALRQVVEQIVSGGKSPDRRDILDELLHMISCKAAIKAGDRLSPEEVRALLELRHQYRDSHHCPHGRPTSLVFTRDELDRRFKRI